MFNEISASFFHLVPYLHFSHRWVPASMVERRNSLEAALLVLMVLRLARLHFLAPLQTD